MKDKYYGFIAGLIIGDTYIANKKRGYSDNTAIFLTVLNSYCSNASVTPKLIIEDITKCYSEKRKYKYASCISYESIKPSLAIAMKRYNLSGEIMQSENMELSCDIIFRALVSSLLSKFSNPPTFNEIVVITHAAPMTLFYLTFLHDFFHLIFAYSTKAELQKFIELRGYNINLLSVPGKMKCNDIGEVIRCALQMFFIYDIFLGDIDQSNYEMNVKGLYGMISGAYYGFKYLHDHSLVKIDSVIMDLITLSYS